MVSGINILKYFFSAPRSRSSFSNFIHSFSSWISVFTEPLQLTSVEVWPLWGIMSQLINTTSTKKILLTSYSFLPVVNKDINGI